MRYNALTRQHFEAAATAGRFEESGVFGGAAGDPRRGVWVQFEVRPSPSSQPAAIEAMRFLAFGCPHVIAVAAWLTERSAGLAIEPRLPESVEALSARFAVPIEKRGRLLIVEDAWIAAMHAGLSAVGAP